VYVGMTMLISKSRLMERSLGLGSSYLATFTRYRASAPRATEPHLTVGVVKLFTAKRTRPPIPNHSDRDHCVP
jgi:hypothetical protein